MRQRPALVALGVVLTCAVSVRSAGLIQRADGREFVVRLTPAAPTRTCHVQSFQGGPFGGYGDISVIHRGGGAFGIRTGIGGQPATTLKIAIWCRGYAMATLTIASLQSSTFEAAVSLTSLAEEPMTGRVLPSPDGASMAGATLRVSYSAPWLCEFFSPVDCLVPQWEVAVDQIKDDGTFRVLVPDFAHDPAVQAPAPGEKRRDGFRLRVDRKVAPYNYLLEPEGSSPWTQIPVAATYPELVLRPRRN